MVTVLHFSDAHIDMAINGRRDPASGLPIRVLDFLKALDTIIDTAITEKVDLVLFAGDAYRDRTPVPTFQREWGRRIMRLSAAGIPTVLLVGNHDLSPAVGRANALQEFETLEVPHIRVVSRPVLLGPEQLEGLPLQIMALPWVSRSTLMAARGLSGTQPSEVFETLENSITELIQKWLERADSSIPIILTAHASVQGAVYGGERSVMLGNDLVLPVGLVRNPRFDYVALGHIHKAQNLNDGAHPPIIYPGSIERVDFGEAADEKCFVIAHVNQGETNVEWRRLEGRKFIDRFIRINSQEDFSRLSTALPSKEKLADAIVRLVVEYPRELEPLLDEAHLRSQADSAFEFHLVRRPQVGARLRIPGDKTIASLTPLELLEMYWQASNTSPEEIEDLKKLATEILSAPEPAAGEGSS